MVLPDVNKGKSLFVYNYKKRKMSSATNIYHKDEIIDHVVEKRQSAIVMCKPSFPDVTILLLDGHNMQLCGIFQSVTVPYKKKKG